MNRVVKFIIHGFFILPAMHLNGCLVSKSNQNIPSISLESVSSNAVGELTLKWSAEIEFDYYVLYWSLDSNAHIDSWTKIENLAIHDETYDSQYRPISYYHTLYHLESGQTYYLRISGAMGRWVNPGPISQGVPL